MVRDPAKMVLSTASTLPSSMSSYNKLTMVLMGVVASLLKGTSAAATTWRLPRWTTGHMTRVLLISLACFHVIPDKAAPCVLFGSQMGLWTGGRMMLSDGDICPAA